MDTDIQINFAAKANEENEIETRPTQCLSGMGTVQPVG